MRDSTPTHAHEQGYLVCGQFNMGFKSGKLRTWDEFGSNISFGLTQSQKPVQRG